MLKYFVIALFISVSVFVFAGGETQPRQVQIEKLFQQHLQAMNSLASELDNWNKAIESLDKAGMQVRFKDCRKLFKQNSIWIALVEPSAEKQFNGANLPSADYDEVTRNVLPPTGFQVIEELIYTDDTAIDIQGLKSEITKLRALISQYIQRNKSMEVSEAELWNALRQSLVFQYTLGITGFDNPIALNSITEAAWQTEAIQIIVQELYAENYSKILISQFENAKSYLLQHPDFNQFDRLEYYKKYWQPLYARTIDFQQQLNIPFYASYRLGKAQAINDTVRNLFDPNFLNVNFYLHQKNANDDEAATQSWTALGSALFSDVRLSADGKSSCASCHHKDKALAENLKVSVGGGNRNSPSLNYAAYQQNQFWDMRIEHLEEQPEHVILNKKEFGTTYATIIEKLKKTKYYSEEFAQLLPNEKNPINPQSIGKALAYYIASLSKFDSRFDAYMQGKTNSINAEIAQGYNLFMGKAKCATCHFAPVFNGTVPPLFNDSESEILGVLKTDNFKHPVLDDDLGRGGRNLIDIHMRSFKTPTVRNIKVTAPYMHNGSVKNLDSVIAFYNYGGGAGMGLEVPFQTLPSDSLKLNKKEIAQLSAFMKSLTDGYLIKK